MTTPHQSQSQEQREKNAEEAHLHRHNATTAQDHQAHPKRERDAMTDARGMAPRELTESEGRIKGRYTDEQPGLDPGNLPNRRLSGGGREHKANFDLEDITGNPGHYNINPNAPTHLMHPPDKEVKAAEPPVAREAPPLVEGHLPSLNEPPGSQVVPVDPGEGSDGDLAPELLSIDPDAAVIGDADLTLTCTGEDFDESSVIVFNGGEEPTTFVSPTELTTMVRPSTATTAGEFPVTVRNAHGESEPVMFEFVEAARSAHARSRPKKPAKQSKKKAKGRR